VAGLAAVFGSGAMTNSIEEIENADCIFIIGSNTSIAHPLIATRVFRAKAKGAKLIVADPRRIPIILQSDLHLQQNLGTDVALINGLMHIILKKGWQDQAFIDERTENFEELKKVVENYPPEKGNQQNIMPRPSGQLFSIPWALPSTPRVWTMSSPLPIWRCSLEILARNPQGSTL
jgi:predicted molibdopterin-dependent oxidoreductase YjgC